jgi:signal transduction histidine kinase
MKVRTWAVVAVALGGLLLLLALSLLATRRRVQEIYLQLDAINVRHREVESTLRRLRGDFHVSGIFVRDYLLDTSRTASPEYREDLSSLRAQTEGNLAALERLVPGEAVRIQRLKSKIADYWEVFDPLFDWTPAEKSARSLTFVRREVIPRRDEVLKIAQEIEDLNDSNMKDQRAQVALREAELRHTLNAILGGSLGLGALVALVAVARIRVLETRSLEQHERTELAEDEMRHLSQRLVQAQEDERRRLARELHDEIGQMLTALRMELGKADRGRSAAANGAFAASIAECKRIIDTVMESVRALSMGLRPAMLDDFGLGTALDWHARDFSRRYNVPVFLTLEGNVDRLPEPLRTCVYRVVQEALTNCAKHAQATRVEVSLRDVDRRLQLSISDDGVGLETAEQRRAGVGLVGIEERVREIGGRVSIRSHPGAGTTLLVDIPIPPLGEGDHESPAG